MYFFNISVYRYEESINNFQKAQKLLRGNRFVDYKQLGFSFKLFECEVKCYSFMSSFVELVGCY